MPIVIPQLLTEIKVKNYLNFLENNSETDISGEWRREE
jgi:hypothetical protein